MRRTFQLVALVVAGLCLALVIEMANPRTVQASISRSISEVASKSLYARDSSIGNGPSAEAVDFQDLGDFFSNTRTFSVQIQNEDATNALLVQFVESGTVTASELTSPDASGTVTNVQSIPASETIAFDVACVGIIWQSAAGNNAASVRATY